MGIQEVVGADNDGFFGKHTEQAVEEWQELHRLPVTGEVDQETLDFMLPSMDNVYKILEVITCFEVGFCRNAWNKVTTVQGDGAGRNLGVMQHNRYGSISIMQKKYGFDDAEEWYGTPAGAKGQLEYFLTYILKPARDFANLISDKRLTTLLMLCDSLVQGGTLYPSRPPRSGNWADWPWPELKQTVIDLYKRLPVKEAFIQVLQLVPEPGKMYADLHPRSGAVLFLADQLERRRTAYRGFGRVHGDYYDLSNYGFTNQ